MGLNLEVVSFHYWLEERVERPFQKEFLNRLEAHIGQKIDFSRFNQVDVDTESPRVGSYKAYRIFRHCLRFITFGDYEDQLEEDDRLEKEALLHFRQHLTPKSSDIPYVAHVLETNDADTLFLPVIFAEPFELYDGDYEIDVGSVPAILVVLKTFSEAIFFDLYGKFEDEQPYHKWNPLSTAKNVARVIFKFFKDNENCCISFS